MEYTSTKRKTQELKRALTKRKVRRKKCKGES
jgi:hypothetical protein